MPTVAAFLRRRRREAADAARARTIFADNAGSAGAARAAAVRITPMTAAALTATAVAAAATTGFGLRGRVRRNQDQARHAGRGETIDSQQGTHRHRAYLGSKRSQLFVSGHSSTVHEAKANLINVTPPE